VLPLEQSIVPDIAVFQWNHIPITADGKCRMILNDIQIGLSRFSLNKKPNQVMATSFIVYACRLGWFIDPDDRSVLVTHSDQANSQGCYKASACHPEGIELN